jgi:biotin carboxyl carrier protein
MGQTGDDYTGFKVYMAEYKTTLTEKYKKSRGWKPPDKNQVTAAIPGTILEVQVKKGQFIAAGKTLVVLDAMKMENHIVMPFDGKIKGVHVRPGDIVLKNQLLIDIEA